MNLVENYVETLEKMMESVVSTVSVQMKKYEEHVVSLEN